jgi:ribosomal protein S18 acetylase RimI-like enzyme
VRIRDATVADKAGIVRIARASFDRVYAFFAVRGTRHAWPFLVTEDGPSITGFLEGILFRGAPPIGYVYFVAVDPRARGMGSGRALVQGSLQLFRSRGADRVFAAVPKDNDPSMRLFESLGFERVARRVLWRWYRWRGLSVQMRMLLAPHEVLLARTFTDLPPASPQEVPRAS